MEERRSFSRINFEEPVRFELKDPSQFGGCLSRDISRGGVRVSVNDFIPFGTELSVQVQMPSKKVIECSGKVVWVEKARFNDSYQLGLEFNIPVLSI